MCIVIAIAAAMTTTTKKLELLAGEFLITMSYDYHINLLLPGDYNKCVDFSSQNTIHVLLVIHDYHY